MFERIAGRPELSEIMENGSFYDEDEKNEMDFVSAAGGGRKWERHHTRNVTSFIRRRRRDVSRAPLYMYR